MNIIYFKFLWIQSKDEKKDFDLIDQEIDIHSTFECFLLDTRIHIDDENICRNDDSIEEINEEKEDKTK